MSGAIVTVWLKELKDALRDKRSLMAAMSYAFFGPMLMAVAFFAVVKEATSESDVQVHIQGQEYAPELVQFLQQKGIVAVDKEEADSGVELTIPRDYQNLLASGKMVSVVVRADYSERKNSSSRQRISSALREYNQTIASARLTLRGISPEVMYAVVPEKQDTATKESRAAVIMGTVMVFVLMAVFFSGMNVAIDTSAGERERNSLEFLLAQPVKLFDLVTGKALAASTFAALGSLLTLAMIPLVFMFVPLEKLGIDITFSVMQQLILVLVLMPLALLASGLQLFVSFMAKSFKEAQTYISFVMFAPMTIVFVLEFSRFSHWVLDYLPVTSQHQVLLGSINGEPVGLIPILVGAVSTLLLAWALLVGVQLRLRSEKAVFGL